LKKITGCIILLLLFISTIGFPSARADGSVDAQEVWVEWYQGNWKGQGADTDAQQNLDDNMFALYHDTEYNFSLLNVDTINITQLRTYVKWDETIEAFLRDWRVAVYNYIAQDNAGSRVNYEDWELQNVDGTPAVFGYVTRTLMTPWELSGGNEYFFAFGCEGGAGFVRMQRSTNGAQGSGSLFDTASGQGSDPFNEWASYNGTEYNIQIRYWGYKDKLTTFNQYYGTPTDYIARRDINYTFPSGVNNRKIRITLPTSDHLVNITRSNGGSWDTTLSESDYSVSDYNGTHNLITISNSPLSLYGGDYRVFTASYPYYYQFDGLYFENGTKNGNVNISVYLPSGSSEYQVDGPSNYGFNEKPIQAVWGLGGGGTRRIYLYDATESITFFTPDDDYASYSIIIKDYTGSIGLGNTYLEALKIINGTEQIIERVLVTDAINAIPLTLTKNQIYTLQIRLADNSIYRFGYFIPASDPTPTIILNQIPFSSQTHYLGEDVSALATRPTPTHIQLTYLDESELTIELNLEILYLNRTTAFTDSATGEPSVTFNWYNAHNESDFIIKLNINHYLYGESTYTAWLIGEKPATPEPPDIDTLIGKGTTNALSIIIILAALMIGSRGGAIISLILADLVAFILISVGLLTSPFGYGPPILVLVLIWVYAMGANRK